jgi:alpha-galactosidase
MEPLDQPWSEEERNVPMLREAAVHERQRRRRRQALLLTAVMVCACSAVAQPKMVSALPMTATPPMGWANWNGLGCNYDEAKIRSMADHLVSSGMVAAGYRYLIIQECIVPFGHRAADGTLLPDPKKFPHGIPALVAYIHARGLKAGIYTDVGRKTCAGYEGSFGHEDQDARTFASWGIDLVEEDFCDKPDGFTAAQLYTRMRDAIAHSGRPMLFYICNQGREMAWTWAPRLSNVWRSTYDVSGPGRADWTYILRNFDQNAYHSAWGGVDHWSDPDMLEVGVPGISATEAEAMFSLWAISAAPLWAGNDLDAMTEPTLRILTNREVIAVDQDPLGRPGTLVEEKSPGLQVWARPLAGRERAQAVVLFNRTAKEARIEIPWADLGIYGPAAVRDLQAHREIGVLTAGYATEVPAHATAMLRVTPQAQAR